MKKLTTTDITLLGLFSAVILVQTYVWLGYLMIGPISITTIHLTVIIAACLLGPRLGALIGGIWGVTSWIYAFQSAGLLNVLFYNPLISVVPRVAVGFIAGLLFSRLSKRYNLTLSSSIAGVVGTITNTVLVLSGFFFFGYDTLQNFLTAGTITINTSGIDPVLTYVLSLVTTNSLAEIIAAAIVVPLVVTPLRRFIKKDH